ncbi:hypothetical protein FEM48_ZijujUnG0123100 [Ziziphus jujuba var. spinosa]|uniref:DUF4219 domain-containing protein n=1 Tax=Ziziphus jujuba var. spinosa TaxID=714518 RepID=A0A978U7S4_ZIZJJ|nr:hypothetical protein FEM48_ZijujUnG0123100 [Ziziphus jujuba var. spinosa]
MSSEQIGSSPPKFDESNYHLWAFKMQAYLEALNLWEAVEQDTDPPPLPDNPTREFDLMKMKEGENIKEYASWLLDVAKKIRFLAQDFPDENIIEKLFISLPTKYESKISALEESVDTKTLDISELISRLNIRDDEEDNVEGAF